MQELIEFCRELIKCDSSTISKTPNSASNYIISELEKLGLDYEVLECDGVKNVIVEIKQGNSDKVLAITAHWDTVNVTDLWTIAPFSAEIKDNKIYGLGASDDKAQVAVMLELLRQYSLGNLKFNGNLRFFFVGNEEIGGKKGTKIVAQSKYGEGINYLLNGEPTDLKIQKGRRGAFGGKINVYGKQTHAAMSHQGENALDLAIKIYQELSGLEFEKSIKGFPPTHFNITRIYSDNSPNIIPGNVSLIFDCRCAPPETSDTILKKIESKLSICGKDKFNLEIVYEPFEPFEYINGEFMDVAVQVYDTVMDNYPNNNEEKFRFWGGISDTKYFLGKDIQIIEFGVDSSMMHKPDEFVSIQDLEKVYLFYKGVIEENR